MVGFWGRWTGAQSASHGFSRYHSGHCAIRWRLRRANATPRTTASSLPTAEYRIGPGDNLNIFVWRNPELTVTVPVRPDGRLSIPLVEDVVAIGKTPSTLAREYEQRLAKYVKEPLVTVIVEGFVGPIPDSIRIIGEASQPRALPYRADMTVLDAMIAVGGLTRYAAGNDTVLIRTAQGEQNTYSVHLNNLSETEISTAMSLFVPAIF